jgi:hypothetical protein
VVLDVHRYHETRDENPRQGEGHGAQCHWLCWLQVLFWQRLAHRLVFVWQFTQSTFVALCFISRMQNLKGKIVNKNNFKYIRSIHI